MGRRHGCPIVLLAVLCLLTPVEARAQAPGSSEDAAAQGMFPDATFEATFRKYTPPRGVFSPYYSWDAHMALDFAIVRRGANALRISGIFQSVGTENIKERISVGGTGYLLGLHFVHTRSETFQISSGFVHFSSHLTRDLDEKLEEQRAQGATVPRVDEPDEYNVVWVKGTWTLRERPLAPELELVLQPLSFRFNGNRPEYIRPVFLGTRWTLYRGGQKQVRVETQQEIGENPFINVLLVYAVCPRNQPEGRLQLFLSGSPGGTVRVSPQIGALRGGVAFGMRLRFRA